MPIFKKYSVNKKPRSSTKNSILLQYKVNKNDVWISYKL